MTISLVRHGDRLSFRGEYTDGFPKAARREGGDWRQDGENNAWVFPAGNLTAVVELVKQFYGVPVAVLTEQEAAHQRFAEYSVEHLSAALKQQHRFILDIEEQRDRVKNFEPNPFIKEPPVLSPEAATEIEFELDRRQVVADCLVALGARQDSDTYRCYGTTEWPVDYFQGDAS